MTKIITREQITHKIESSEPITLVEALPSKYFKAGHLPGAINIPHDEVRERAAEMLPDKDALIVVYCASSECQNSRLAANALQQMGYTNALDYVEGKQHWLDASLPIESDG